MGEVSGEASVISFSPNFNETVRTIRLDLGITSEGFSTAQEMDEWYKRHHAENQRNPVDLCRTTTGTSLKNLLSFSSPLPIPVNRAE